MSSPEVPDDARSELTDLEAALRSFVPATSRLDRDRLMFRAGQAQAPPARRPGVARWAWPAVAAGLAVVALGECAWIARRPGPRVVERLVVQRVPEPTPVPGPAVAPPTSSGPAPVVILSRAKPPATTGRAPSWSGASYARLREQVLRYGVEFLPEPAPLAMQPTGGGATTSAELLRSELDAILNPGESS